MARTVARADWGLREERHNKLHSEVAASELSASERARISPLRSGSFRTEVSERTFCRRAAPRLARGGGLVGIVKVAHVTGGGGTRTHGRRCVHGRSSSHRCKDCGGRGICAHGRRKQTCRECGGVGICAHGRRKQICRECGGVGICVHGRERHTCRECGGVGICAHGRRRHRCKDCGGSSICAHGRRRYRCKECGGSSICAHGRERRNCGQCRGLSAHKSHTSKCKKNGGSSGI